MAITAITSVVFYNQSASALWTPTVQPDMNAGYTRDYGGIISNQAFGGQTYTVEKFGLRKSWNLSWSFLGETDRDNADTLIAYTKGRLNWFKFSPNGGTTKFDVYFTVDQLQFQEVAYRAYSLSIPIIEKL